MSGRLYHQVGRDVPARLNFDRQTGEGVRQENENDRRTISPLASGVSRTRTFTLSYILTFTLIHVAPHLGKPTALRSLRFLL